MYGEKPSATPSHSDQRHRDTEAGLTLWPTLKLANAQATLRSPYMHAICKSGACLLTSITVCNRQCKRFVASGVRVLTPVLQRSCSNALTSLPLGEDEKGRESLGCLLMSEYNPLWVSGGASVLLVNK